MKFPLHINIMLVYVNCGHFQWKLSLASQPPWFLSPPPLSPARTSSPQCSPAPCRSSCTWTVDIWENFFGNHFYIVDPTTSQFDRERLRQKSLTPYLGYFPKERGLFVCFGFPIKSRTDCRFPYLVTLSPQNSVITVCPVTPSTFVHIIVNVCTYINFNIFTYRSKPSFHISTIARCESTGPISPPFALHTELIKSSHTPKVFLTIWAQYFKHFEYLRNILLVTFAVDLWINLFPSTVTMELKMAVRLFYLWIG